MNNVKEYLESKKNNNYEEAKQLYLKGYSLTQIEKELGINRKRLSCLLRNDGIEITQNNQKYKYNENIFDLIDSEDKAYWLGFIYADGCVNIIPSKRLSIALQLSDIDHLKLFKCFMETNAVIEKRAVHLRTTSKDYNSCRIMINNAHIVDQLIDKNCYPNKSDIITFPYDKMPKELYRHFIRGFIDGDGTICKMNGKNSLGVMSASFKFIEEFQKVLCSQSGIKKTKISLREREGRKTIYEFRNTGESDMLKLYDYLYKDSNIYLQRKHNKLYERVSWRSKTKTTEVLEL